MFGAKLRVLPGICVWVCNRRKSLEPQDKKDILGAQPWRKKKKKKMASGVKTGSTGDQGV